MVNAFSVELSSDAKSNTVRIYNKAQAVTGTCLLTTYQTLPVDPTMAVILYLSTIAATSQLLPLSVTMTLRYVLV